MGSAARKQNGEPADSEVHAFIDSSEISVEDVLRGLWDGAIIDEITVDSRYPFHAPLGFSRFFASSIQVDGGKIYMQIKTFSKQLEKPAGENWGSSCRVQVFSQSSGAHAGCNLDPKAWGITRTTLAPTADPRYVKIDFTGSGWVNGTAWGAQSWASYGHIEFKSGPNAGNTFFIKSWTVTHASNFAEAYLQKPLPYAHTTGDTVFILPGCTHLLLGDGGCVKKFNNAINFQGELVPGRDAALELVF